MPKFFSKKRSVASLINFDADLYSSTICALNNTKDIIDEDTILVFDEFLMNDHWEEDEYKALEEFCNNFNFSYDVLAVSFYTKQIVVKLKKLWNQYQVEELEDVTKNTKEQKKIQRKNT